MMGLAEHAIDFEGPCSPWVGLSELSMSRMMRARTRYNKLAMKYFAYVRKSSEDKEKQAPSIPRKRIRLIPTSPSDKSYEYV